MTTPRDIPDENLHPEEELPPEEELSPKDELRRAAHIRRAAMGADELDQVSKAICERLWSMVSAVPEVKTVAVYCALPGEVKLKVFIEQLWDEGYTVAFPRIIDDETLQMEFHETTEFPTEKSQFFSGYEPSAELPTVVPDVVVVPGLAFTKSGDRLGFGGGYYDHWLVSYPSMIAVGVCAQSFIVPTVHTEDHDVSVDVVVTQSNLYR